MKLKINLASYEVEQVVDFDSLAGSKNNGQHWQLPGYALAEVGIGQRQVFHLLHPETEGTKTGHIDIIVDFHGNMVTFRRYSGSEPILFTDYAFQSMWPSGEWNLLMVVDAIEQSLKEKEVGYSPILRGWLISHLN